MVKPRFKLIKYLLISTSVFVLTVFVILAVARVDESVEVWGEVSLRDYDLVHAPASGFIDSVCVEQGQLIRRNQLLALIRADQGLKGTEILSPAEGLIYCRDLDQLMGRHFKKGEVLMMVSGPYEIGFRALVPEKGIPFVQKGLEANLFIDAFPYQRFGTFQAVVTSISPLSETQGENVFYPIVLSIKNPYVESEISEGQPRIFLKPGMRGKARIITRSSKSVLNRLIKRFLS